MSYKILSPIQNTWPLLQQSPLLLPFSEPVIGFIRAFTQAIYDHPQAKQYPELIALAFWFRAKKLKELAEDFAKCPHVRLPRGLVFHVAPANVDTIFIYSWFLSMLVGNRNILRVSSQPSAQISLLLEIINQLCDSGQYVAISHHFLIINYAHNDKITGEFSAHCDMRVIWGGNKTIQTIRKSALSPTAIEMTFANKFSFCILDAKVILDTDDLTHNVTQFYNDTYTFNQLGCSSPRLVIWRGKDKDIMLAKNKFWALLSQLVMQKQVVTDEAVNMNKLVASYAIALQNQGQLVDNSKQAITRIQLKTLDDTLFEQHSGGGLFYEYDIQDLKALTPIMHKSIQTITYYGISQSDLTQWILSHIPAGIDRLVPLGSALTFSQNWDGFELLKQFSRVISISA